MSNSRDQALIKRCQRGDRRALEELLQHYQRPVFNVALRMLGNTSDASDVTQNVFLKVFEKFDRYDPEYKFFSWVYRIAINESINLINRGRRDEPLDEASPGNDPGPEKQTESSADSERIQEALLTLSEDYRTVVVLRHFSEMSYREISTVLHIPEITVKSRLYSARQLLKEQLIETQAG